MTRRILRSAAAPRFDGAPLSPGIETEEFVFAVGIAVDETTGTRLGTAESIADETSIALEMIEAILREAGCSLRDVVKTTVYLSDAGDFDAMNATYAHYWREGDEPVRCTLFVGIGAGCRVEIDAVAVKDSGPADEFGVTSYFPRRRSGR